MHYTDCCLSARQTATRAKTIRLRPKTSCHGLLFSSPCIGPISWQTCLGAKMILQGHPSMRNSLPPPGDLLALHFQAVWPSIHQRWSSCRCHSHSLHCCHHPSRSRRIHNSVDELRRPSSTWDLDMLGHLVDRRSVRVYAPRCAP